MNIIKKVYHPEIYHGHKNNKTFFEGWYYKIVNPDASEKFAIIPGVFLGPKGYAFIQFLDGKTGDVEFIKYSLNDFSSGKKNFHIYIKNNFFQLNQFNLDIKTEKYFIQGKLTFQNINGWPINLFLPGIMGWYAWIPKMECYHGLLGFNPEINGELTINDRIIDFSGGKAYLEKDWGTAFPEAYIWMQSNHFKNKSASFSASIAIIPWLNNKFKGFIVGLSLDDKLYRFTTYLGSKCNSLSVSQTEVKWVLSNKDYILEIIAHRGITGNLKGPTRKEMNMRVAESLDAIIHLKLSRKNGTIIFNETGYNCGLEIAGNINELINMK